MAAVASRFDRLGFDSPRCEAAKELVRLAAARDGLVAKLDALDAEQRDAGATVARLADELAELERSSYSDGKVDPAEREQAEQALADARRNHQAPWAERRDGLRRAIADADAELHRQIAARFTDLVSEVEDDGRAAADAVDRAARMLVEAALERAHHAERLDALISSVRGRSQFGDVLTSRADEAAGEAARLLERGGERPPTVRDGLVVRGPLAKPQAAA